MNSTSHFSNSVIEHVPPQLQSKFAEEVARVATRYFVQTPNRYFPIEPHYQLPLFQFLPKGIRKALNKRFALGWQANGQWEEIDPCRLAICAGSFRTRPSIASACWACTKSIVAVRS